MKWVTRERVHLDRTACPWLIKKFIDSQAEFIFVSLKKIEEVAKAQGAIPFDAPGVKPGHKNDKCSFETIIEEYRLEDQVLHELAKIVHSADTRDTKLAPEGIGLNVIMTGARFNVKDDFEAVDKAAYVYDAFYNYSRLKSLCEKHKDELEKMNSSKSMSSCERKCKKRQ